MTITEVRVVPLDVEGKVKAVASVTFDGEFVVHDLRIVEGQNGLFVAMPSKRAADGSFKDIAHPVTAEARDVIQQAVLQAFYLNSEAGSTSSGQG